MRGGHDRGVPLSLRAPSNEPYARLKRQVAGQGLLLPPPRSLRWFTASQAVVFPLMWPLQSLSMHMNSARRLLTPGGGLHVLELAVFIAHLALYGGFAFFLAEQTGSSQAILFVVVHQGAF